MARHGGGLRDRPNDMPFEEQYVAATKAQKQKKIDDATFALEQLAWRSMEYVALGDPKRDGDLAIVRARQNARLDELIDAGVFDQTEEI